jgi:hypothetical protein
MGVVDDVELKNLKVKPSKFKADPGLTMLIILNLIPFRLGKPPTILSILPLALY